MHYALSCIPHPIRQIFELSKMKVTSQKLKRKAEREAAQKKQE
jgi:hypothetical protein